MTTKISYRADFIQKLLMCACCIEIAHEIAMLKMRGLATCPLFDVLKVVILLLYFIFGAAAWTAACEWRENNRNK